MSNKAVTNAPVEGGSKGEGDEETSVKSVNSFVIMLWNIFAGDLLGKRKQGDETGPPNLCCIDLDDREDISPFPSPYYYSRKQESNESATTYAVAHPSSNIASRFQSKKSKNLDGFAGLDSNQQQDSIFVSNPPTSSKPPAATDAFPPQITSGIVDDESSELEELALGLFEKSTANKSDRALKTPSPFGSDEFSSGAVKVTPDRESDFSKSKYEGTPQVKSGGKSRQGLFAKSTTCKTDRGLKTPSPFSSDELPPGLGKITPDRESESSESTGEDVDEDRDAIVLPEFGVVDNGKLAAMKRIKPKATAPRFSPSENERIPVWNLADDDILGSRKSTGTKHIGTLDFLELIRNFYPLYDSYGSQHKKKTKLTNRILEEETTSRFVRKVGKDEYDLMTFEEARSKVSQSFREERARQLKMNQ